MASTLTNEARDEAITRAVAILETLRDEYLADAESADNDYIAIAHRAQAMALETAITRIQTTF